MITDLAETRPAKLPEYDLCIVGSGPSGMTVASELKGSGLKICVLESGRLKPTPHGDGLRKVLSEGIQIKDYSRERVLGGASTTWSGLSSTLDPVDMEPRPYLEHSGWPFERDVLMPYYEAAADRYRFPPLRIFGPEGMAAVRERGDLKLAWEEVEEKIFMAAGEPQNFGREFMDLFESQDIDLYLDATLVRLEREMGTGNVTHGSVRSQNRGSLNLKARVFVLAAGGIENARILLNSENLGNEHDQVGRYLMNHPKNYYGVIRLNRPVRELPYYFGCLFQGYAGYAGLRLKEADQRSKGLLNCYVRFEPLFPWSDNPGVESLVFLAKRFRLLYRSWRRLKKSKMVSLRDYAETGDDSELQNKRKSGLEWLGLYVNILLNLPKVLRYLYHRLFERSELKISEVRLRNFMEMAPRPDNRVLLGAERDVYGQPVPVVRHDSSARDRRSLLLLHEVLSREFSRNGFGIFKSRLHEERPWPIHLDASHHLGTTRMGEDPRSSVVNPNLRLHQVENVYLAGGSVFPTSGCSNPTFTMVALSIRLAEHLGRAVFDSGQAKR
jgi:choline dehydrogenase-like flavoprotein